MKRRDALGHLETAVMEVLWTQGPGSVHDVIAGVNRPLAYTTVMTTLDRLFKKELLDREESNRTFVYSPRFSRVEWEQKKASNFLAGFLRGPEPSGELLISCFLDVVGEQDERLLDELEKKIALKRKELQRRGRP